MTKNKGTTVVRAAKPRARTRKRALDLRSEEGKFTTRRASYHRGTLIKDTEMESDGTVCVPKFEGPVGRVGVSGSVTKNMGDFNSVRVEVRADVPAYAEESEMNRAYDFCTKFVDDKIANELALATGAAPEPDDGAGSG